MALINQGGGRSLEGEGCLHLNLLSSQVNLTLDLTGSGGPYKGNLDMGKGVMISTTDGERGDLFVVYYIQKKVQTPSPLQTIVTRWIAKRKPYQLLGERCAPHRHCHSDILIMDREQGRQPHIWAGRTVKYSKCSNNEGRRARDLFGSVEQASNQVVTWMLT